MNTQLNRENTKAGGCLGRNYLDEAISELVSIAKTGLRLEDRLARLQEAVVDIGREIERTEIEILAKDNEIFRDIQKRLAALDDDLPYWQNLRRRLKAVIAECDGVPVLYELKKAAKKELAAANGKCDLLIKEMTEVLSTRDALLASARRNKFGGEKKVDVVEKETSRPKVYLEVDPGMVVEASTEIRGVDGVFKI